MPNVAEAVEIEIPADILAELEGAKSPEHWNAYPWQDWQDAVILKYWEGAYGEHGVTKEKICDILGSKGMRRPSRNTVQKHYEELTREG